MAHQGKKTKRQAASLVQNYKKLHSKGKTVELNRLKDKGQGQEIVNLTGDIHQGEQ